MRLLDPLLSALLPAGLNLSGVVSAAAWDAAMPPARQTEALLPGGRAILVLGNGGDALWQAFLTDLRQDPTGLTAEQHPIDAYVRRQVLAADSLLGAVPRRWFWAAADADLHLDFRVLAALGGLGATSRLGLLIHRRYGTWLGLRAACVLAADVSIEGALAAPPDLCDGCPAPCVSACPGSAFPKGTWDVVNCTTHHSDSGDCERLCHARMACPVGLAERYPPEQIGYHTHRESGRRWLRAHLGLPDGADPYEGIGPHWGDWRARVNVVGGGGTA